MLFPFSLVLVFCGSNECLLDFLLRQELQENLGEGHNHKGQPENADLSYQNLSPIFLDISALFAGFIESFGVGDKVGCHAENGVQVEDVVERNQVHT